MQNLETNEELNISEPTNLNVPNSVKKLLEKVLLEIKRLDNPYVLFDVDFKNMIEVEDIKHIFIQKQITCEPCVDKKCEYQKCMLQISSKEVFDQILNIIEF